MSPTDYHPPDDGTAPDVVIVRTFPSGQRVLVDHVLPRDPRLAESEWKRARLTGYTARFDDVQSAKHVAMTAPGFGRQWLLDQVRRVEDAHHRGVSVADELVDQMQAVREVLGRRFAGLEHEIRKAIASVDTSWRRDGRSVSPLVARPRTLRGRTRVRHREHRPGRTRRASSSSSTSGSDPGDDGDPDPAPLRHPRYGRVNANMLAVLEAVSA